MMAPVGMPSLAAPRLSRSLFSLGGAVQSLTPRRCAIMSNHGAIASWVYSPRPKLRCQYASVAGGVRKLEVQLTVVEPPTVRPCRMLIALSAVLRAADSWYSAG